MNIQTAALLASKEGEAIYRQGNNGVVIIPTNTSGCWLCRCKAERTGENAGKMLDANACRSNRKRLGGCALEGRKKISYIF